MREIRKDAAYVKTRKSLTKNKQNGHFWLTCLGARATIGLRLFSGETGRLAA
jgi:hypothetical protein